MKKFKCMSTKQWFETEHYETVQMSNGRYRYVADSPFKAGRSASRFADSSKRKSDAASQGSSEGPADPDER